MKKSNKIIHITIKQSTTIKNTKMKKSLNHFKNLSSGIQIDNKYQDLSKKTLPINNSLQSSTNTIFLHNTNKISSEVNKKK